MASPDTELPAALGAPERAPTDAVVLFDGECNLCNGAVGFLIRRDASGRLKFASLQSEVGAALAASVGVDATALSTFVLVEGGQASVRSTAALRVVRYLRFPWPVLSVFRLVPAFLRDPVYRWVAANRYRWFGKRSTCRLPSPEEASRFLESA